MKKCVLGTCNCTVLLLGAALILGGALPASAQTQMCCLADGGCQNLSQATCEEGGGISYAGRDCDPDLDIEDGNGQCPDCNCDGETDAKEIGDCTAQCVAGGGNPDECRDACSVDCTLGPVPKKCADGCVDHSSCVAADACDQCNASTGKCGPRDCEDGNKCSIDTCVEISDDPGWMCVSEADHSVCDDNNACTVDICNLNDGGEKSYDSCCKPDANDNCRPMYILDGGFADGEGARCEIVVEDEGFIEDVDVEVTILHPWVGDLVIDLEHKDTGSSARIFNSTCDTQSSDAGGNFFGFNVNGLVGAVFSDQGCTVLDGEACGAPPLGWALSFITSPPDYCPNTALKAFNGEPKQGTWSLTVYDDFDDGGTSDTKGTLESWSLHLDNAPKGCIHPDNPGINDLVDCTIDDCNPLTGEIFHDEDDGACDDADDCTADTCDPENEDSDKAGCVNDFIDKDGDGCCDVDDLCPSDPNKCTSEGVCGCNNPDGDKDKDGVEDCLDPCPNDAKCWDSTCECTDARVRLIVSGQPSGLNTAPDEGSLPADDTTHLQNGCFVVELWAQATNGSWVEGHGNPDATQGHVEKGGLSCVFAEVLWKDGCDFKASTIEYSETFDQFRAGEIDNNGFDDDGFPDITNLGGCTLATDSAGGGVGVFPRWHRVASVFYVGSHSKCKNTFQVGDTEKPSSLKNDELVKNPQYQGTEVAVRCLGDIYNLGDQGDTDQGQITPGDFSLFAPCWMGDATGACAASDFDCDGVVGPGDLAFFATAWQKDVCGSGILVPACQLNCSGSSVDLPWANEELMREFNLPVPGRDWEGWALDPARDKAVRANSVTGRRARR